MEKIGGCYLQIIFLCILHEELCYLFVIQFWFGLDMDLTGKKFYFLLFWINNFFCFFFKYVVSIYGGLRGAVSLSLALVVYNNEELS